MPACGRARLSEDAGTGETGGGEDSARALTRTRGARGCAHARAGGRVATARLPGGVGGRAVRPAAAHLLERGDQLCALLRHAAQACPRGAGAETEMPSSSGDAGDESALTRLSHAPAAVCSAAREPCARRRRAAAPLISCTSSSYTAQRAGMVRLCGPRPRVTQQSRDRPLAFWGGGCPLAAHLSASAGLPFARACGSAAPLTHGAGWRRRAQGCGASSAAPATDAPAQPKARHLSGGVAAARTPHKRAQALQYGQRCPPQRARACTRRNEQQPTPV